MTRIIKKTARRKPRSIPTHPVEPDDEAPPALQTMEERTTAGKLKQELAAHIENLRWQARQLGEEASDAQRELLVLMARDNDDSFKFTDPKTGSRFSVVRVSPKSLVIDELKLRKKVGAEMWRKISRSVLDRPKLDAALKGGSISPRTLAQVSTEKDGTEYVKVTKR